MEKGLEGENVGRYHTLQAHRDLESNWGVDIAKSLEDYLLKICSGEIGGDISVNFAEAALLLQGSIQVYSRKVEYLYNLVLHALEFISQKGQQQNQTEKTTDQPEEGSSGQQQDEEDDFWVSDDIPEDPKNRLDPTSKKDAIAGHFVKPPANLVVLEGDCLDITGDAGELESYLLATCELYRDFILLDPCDAATADEYLKDNEYGKENCNSRRRTSLGPRSGKSFLSPLRQTSGSGRKSSAKKNLDNNLISPGVKDTSEATDYDMDLGPSTYEIPPNDDFGFDMNNEYSVHEDLNNDEEEDEEEDDPWKPLNPHGQGNLKIKPFKKVNRSRKTMVNPKMGLIALQFPLAKIHGPISLELMKIWETRMKANESEKGQESPPLYEKLRKSLVRGNENFSFHDTANDKGGQGLDNDAPDFEEDEADMPYMDEDIRFPSEQDDMHPSFNANEGSSQEDPSSQATLEDLCRSHLDALLASIAESETQTELATRVSSWKQKIETNLEEQDKLPPFDIHEYGDRIMDKLTLDMESGDTMSFTDVVRGQEKHEVARTFSAMLQLVNNGDIDLDKRTPTAEPICFTAANPFYVKLLNPAKKSRKIHLSAAKRKAKSPLRRTSPKKSIDRANRKKPSTTMDSPSNSAPQASGNITVKVGGINVKRTPDSKRRRKSRLPEPVHLKLAG